ncbi:MAG: recombinase family protein, partial [Planctomycetota bacterium]
MNVAVVLPARLKSTRLPDKLLLEAGGKTILAHTVARAREAQAAAPGLITRVLVAADDEKLLAAARCAGVEAVLTSPDHTSGTSRIAEAARGLHEDIIVNLQADEPEIASENIIKVANLLAAEEIENRKSKIENSEAPMATLAVPIFDEAEWRKTNVVKVVLGSNGNALYTVRHVEGGAHHQIFPDGHVQVYANGAKPSKDESARSKLVVGAPERMKVVRRIFEACAHEEKGVRSILEDLNAEGIPSPRGGKWSVGTVRAILSNPVYYGANVWNVRSFSKYHRIESGAVKPLPEPTGKSVNWND